ncbi:ATP-binding protein [Hydrogenophaga taeniospiralis]|uniref:sensor histidine kinase n=1 Tax=Hydrogenophaga taeniospiralis TaxID=65656 RepID=UPI001CFA7A8A|nr:ATP-binding protein [Hydrogenophaga taeniospiralis]UCU94350.1 two-component sensor histidine kinase [Hydrogenophaga taeniospiralis]
MRQTWRNVRWWVLGGTLVSVAGAVLIARQSINTQRAFFETDARIVHRLLSQQAVQHDAILDTLALLQPVTSRSDTQPPEQRLPALYPHILAVQRRDREQTWPDAALTTAEMESRWNRRPALAVSPDGSTERYRLVLAAEPTSYALTIAFRGMVPWAEWPMKPDSSPVRVSLAMNDLRVDLQDGNAPALEAGSGWRFSFQKPLAVASQPFDVVAQQQLGWSQLPWAQMAGWAAAVAAVLILLAQLQRQRTARRRAEELLRLGQVARLNTLGELAAGIAHELNQPLTAVLANTQAAQRLMDDDQPDMETVRRAMSKAVAQARRAADVVGRLRSVVEQPIRQGVAATGGEVDLVDALRRALHLLEPECRRRGVMPILQAPVPVRVMADPVTLDQILHNLLMNALQAMDAVDPSRRALELKVARSGGEGELTVADQGPGMAPDVLKRVFEPFFSTREGGLGLGLSLSETLAQGMGGSLHAANRPEGGAVFVLRLPLQQPS